MATAEKETRRGAAVDFSGLPVIDPSENVKALSEAANKRQDDLREGYEKLFNARLASVDAIAQLRADHAREIGALRAEFDKQTRRLETDRVNAIRQVDVLAVNTAADRAAQAIAALAATTTANAENLRNALTSTAATIATQTANTVTAITERISALEKSMYEGKGKEAIADPAMVQLAASVQKLVEASATGAGHSKGVALSWGVLVGAVGGLVGLVAVIGFVMKVAGV